MINIKKAKIYCKDDITKIENYDEAINDKVNMWHCHHRLELTINGEFAHNTQELERMGMYRKRPYFELIFLKATDHRKLHEQSKPRSQKHKDNISLATKGKRQKLTSIFGEKFFEHYGLHRLDNISLYKKEHEWYRRNHKCRWEK